jgi:hypothetical protein
LETTPTPTAKRASNDDSSNDRDGHNSQSHAFYKRRIKINCSGGSIGHPESLVSRTAETTTAELFLRAADIGASPVGQRRLEREEAAGGAAASPPQQRRQIMAMAAAMLNNSSQFRQQ